MRLCAITMPFPGVRRVFEEGAKLHLWDCLVLDDKMQNVPVYPGEPACYILGAWHPAYSHIIDQLPGRAGVLWTSSSGEVGLEPVEQEYLRKILSDKRISFVWFGDPGLAAVYSERGFWAQYPLNMCMVEPRKTKSPHVTLYQPQTLKKNLLNQLLGVALAQKARPDITLYTNVEIPAVAAEVMGSRVATGWLSRDRLDSLIAGALANMCVSWAETFSYQTAEATMLGTPTLASQAVRWAPPLWQVADPNDPEEIAASLLALIDRNAEALADWRSSLERYVDNFACVRQIKERLS